MLKAKLPVLLTAFSLLSSPSAFASIHEYVFTGVVKQRTVFDGDLAMRSALTAAFPNDTPYTFRFTLDLNEQTTINSSSTLRSYGNSTAFLSGSLVFGPAGLPTYSATITGLGDITIRNEENIGSIVSPILVDSFNLSSAVVTGPSVVSGSTYAVDTFTGLSFSLSTPENSTPKTLFSSTDMPTSLDRSQVQARFSALQFFFREVGGDESFGFVGGGWGNSVDTPSAVTVTPVPEPAHAALLAGLGFLAWGVVRRRARR